MTIDFSRRLIKGRVIETIFEQMIREEGKYEVIPFGYEHTVPTLAQHRDRFTEVEKVINNISDAPDFALISNDKSKLFLVETKYQKTFDFQKVKEYATALCERWTWPWLFIATPDRFYCSMCEHILRDGKIDELPENWVTKDKQAAYLELMGEFLDKPSYHRFLQRIIRR